jgi:hypothetical protein
MSQIHTKRSSRHPLIETIWSTQNISDGVYSATPDGSWDLIVLIQPDGAKSMMLTGQATKPMDVPYKKGTSSIVISFAPGAYLSDYSAKNLVDSFEILPNMDAEHFLLAGHSFAFPTFENAESLVEALIAAKLLVADPIIYGSFIGKPYAISDRSAQRHYAQNTGLKQKDFQQIKRAQKAVRRLQKGIKPSDVAADTGFTDQPHLAKSLKKIMGVTPSDVSDIHKL